MTHFLLPNGNFVEIIRANGNILNSPSMDFNFRTDYRKLNNILGISYGVKYSHNCSKPKYYVNNGLLYKYCNHGHGNPEFELIDDNHQDLSPKLYFLMHPEKLLPKKVNEISETISQIQILIKEKEENINILKKSIDTIENNMEKLEKRINELEYKNIHQQSFIEEHQKKNDETNIYYRSIIEELLQRIDELTNKVDVIDVESKKKRFWIV
jgi:uncharacterized coiled-coil protein SlyX